MHSSRLSGSTAAGWNTNIMTLRLRPVVSCPFRYSRICASNPGTLPSLSAAAVTGDTMNPAPCSLRRAPPEEHRKVRRRRHLRIRGPQRLRVAGAQLRPQVLAGHEGWVADYELRLRPGRRLGVHGAQHGLLVGLVRHRLASDRMPLGAPAPAGRWTSGGVPLWPRAGVAQQGVPLLNRAEAAQDRLGRGLSGHWCGASGPARRTAPTGMGRSWPAPPRPCRPTGR